MDDFLGESVDLVKIDVEGFEADVLSGAEKIIEELRPNLFVEVHSSIAGDRNHEYIFELMENNYSVEYYESEGDRSVGEKVQARYFGGHSVSEIQSREKLRDRCMSGDRAQPFWAVCRS